MLDNVLFIMFDISIIVLSRIIYGMALSLHQLLFRTFHRQENTLQAVRDELGLGRGQPKILTFLRTNGASTQNDIASYFSVDPASISRMTETLRQNGFLLRTQVEDCRRTNRLELTEKGLKAAERWSNECAALEEKMLQGFSPEEAETLRTLLARLLENMVRIEK